ncbi:hypothetical protein LPJ56_006047, partial [Coemansia sp. RSA 2599]
MGDAGNNTEAEAQKRASASAIFRDEEKQMRAADINASTGDLDLDLELDLELELASEHKSDADEEDSPFEMVRAAVSNKDDPNLPCLTFRSWAMGVIFCAALAFVNQFYWFRENSLSLGGYVVQLLSFP